MNVETNSNFECCLEPTHGVSRIWSVGHGWTIQVAPLLPSVGKDLPVTHSIRLPRGAVDASSHVGWVSEQPGLAKGVPAHGQRLELHDL